MHDLEPFYNWRHLYIANQDERSPFANYENSEVYFTDRIYDHIIHPQWDNMGSETLFLKILFVDYEKGFAIIEFLGEWNDLLNNDIMLLKRDIIDLMIAEGITKYILVMENVLNFHADIADYYEEWIDDLEDGWVAAINIRKHVLDEMASYGIDQYLVLGGKLNDVAWRTKSPQQMFEGVRNLVAKRIDF